MKHLVTIGVVAIGSSLLMSCGASKKLEAANAENARLNSLVTDQTSKLAASSNEIAQLKTQNTQYSKDVATCQSTRDALQKNVDAQTAYKNDIKLRFDSIAAKFNEAGAVVTFKDGMVHINFPNSYFFKLNSSTVGVKGRLALNIVADVMHDHPNVQTIIVGNTDTLHVKGIADNWTLSTERANAVVRVLVDTYYINPFRLTAAGRGKFDPVADNSTPEGREKNRRIEIIFNPNLSEFWEYMYK